MLQRCMNPNNKGYKNYGGRGITVCARWQNSFANFLADVGPRPSVRHSIDRHPDNNGSYEPGNVRWATSDEQTRNTRRNRWIEFNGERLILSDWVKRYDLNLPTVIRRLQSGWDITRALTTPTRVRR